jgi:hypothetical protein
MDFWRVERIALSRSEADYTSSETGRPIVTQLLADGAIIGNAMDRTRWNARVVQATLCTDCGMEGCAPGGYVSPRALDGSVVWLPAFDEMTESGAFEPPEYFSRGIPLFTGPSISALLVHLTGLPPIGDLPPLRANELLLLLQWMAPAEILGVFPREVRLRRADVLAVSSGERDARIGELERLLCEASAEHADRMMRARRPDEDPVVFYLDAPGHPEWSPLALVDGEPALHLDGFVLPIG